MNYHNQFYILLKKVWQKVSKKVCQKLYIFFVTFCQNLYTFCHTFLKVYKIDYNFKGRENYK